METYDPQAIETKWQRVWEDEQAFVVPNPDPGELEGHRNKTYVVEMLPYASGELHMGHVLNYTIGDVLVHLRRRSGMQVLRPMGYDAFGLPAENAAIKEGGHPREITERNIETIRGQMRRMGWAIDWSRELSTHEPSFYRWTQWLFLRFFERGLAYRKEAPVKWCPKDQTVLANEQVIDGRCERCGCAPGRDGPARDLARARPDDAAQLDRPLAGRRGSLQGRREQRGAAGLHHPAGHALRRHVLRPRT
jgi:leucyl-tRNA synthetase